MTHIITVGREFGSGGRELGKRLADALHISCYDQEIVDEVAKLQGMDPNHVERISEADIRAAYPATIGRRFAVPPMVPQDSIKVLVSQQKVIQSFASRGDCVVVGHAADVFLKEMSPLNLFVYADQDSKLARCLQRASVDEDMRTILRQMDRINKDRVVYRELLTGSSWGKKETYHLCINTSGKEIKSLIPGIAAYVRAWFGTDEEWS